MHEREGVIVAMTEHAEMAGQADLDALGAVLVANVALYERLVERLHAAGVGLAELKAQVDSSAATALEVIASALDEAITELRGAAFDEVLALARSVPAGPAPLN